MAFAVDKVTVTQSLFDTLNETQKQKYREIVQKRRSIYLTGFGLGVSLAFLATIWLKTVRKTRGFEWSDLCLIGSIVFLTSYFYYILSPKPELMVVYLDTVEQRQTWANIYRTMTFHYHLGLFIGVIAVMIFARGIAY